ncbi:MAG TPA: hypothetical protein PLJ47_01085 [Candidatus Hydrogenedentes bacterium]|nr:hypothetical protein [Candidatus Hydrogenedentota bacterium]
MMLRYNRLLRAVCAVSVTCSAFCAFAADLTVKMVDAEPPAEIAKELRDTLSGKALQLSGPDGTVAEFWFRKEIALKSKPSTSEEALDAMPEVSFVGVARYAKELRDFRDDPIDPGVYTMRAALQLNDGNHLGTAPTSWFVLLVPPKYDTALSGIDSAKKLHDRSRSDSAADHPWCINLQPTPESQSSGDFPKTGANEEWKLVYLKLPASVDGSGEKVEITFGMVYEGHGKM